MKKKEKKINKPILEKTVENNVFVMMRYEDGAPHEQIENKITQTLNKAGLYSRFAKDAKKSGELWENIKIYMDKCTYGIAVFDSLSLRKGELSLNPNICTELGYMLAKGRECLILKEKKLKKLHSDLVGQIYQGFDGFDLETLEKEVANWIDHVVTTGPISQRFANLLPNSKVAKRLHEQAHAKLVIGKYLAEDYFPKNPKLKSIIIDSGTSAAAVAEALYLNRHKYKDFIVHTNNLLASLLLCTKQFKCHIVQGKVDEHSGSVFGKDACTAIEKVNADVAVIACTRFTENNGPYANSVESLEFKRSVVKNSKDVIIIVPSERLGKTGNCVVFKESEWKTIFNNKVSKIIICPPSKTKSAANVIKRLQNKIEILPMNYV